MARAAKRLSRSSKSRSSSPLSLISLIPAVSVPFGERKRARWAPRAGRIGRRLDAVVRPAVLDGVDPCPGSFRLVAPHEQGLVVLDRFQQEPLIGDAPARRL